MATTRRVVIVATMSPSDGVCVAGNMNMTNQYIMTPMKRRRETRSKPSDGVTPEFMTSSTAWRTPDRLHRNDLCWDFKFCFKAGRDDLVDSSPPRRPFRLPVFFSICLFQSSHAALVSLIVVLRIFELHIVLFAKSTPQATSIRHPPFRRFKRESLSFALSLDGTILYKFRTQK